MPADVSNSIPLRKGGLCIAKKFQPLPAVATRLMTLVTVEDVGFREIADLVRVDPAFSAEVLKLANSPLFGCRQEVNNILHAVAILGVERLKSLVMMVALRNFLSRASKLEALRRCWRHSLGCAFLAEEIAATCWMGTAQCYTAGLLHDIGRLALLANYPAQYARLLDAVDQTGGDIIEYEREIFGMDHRELGRLLMIEWNFPAPLPDVAGLHHLEPAPDRFDVRAAVHLACRMADMLGFQVAGPAPPIDLDEIRSKLPDSRRDKMKSEDEMLVTVAGKINALECTLMA
ncbi:MAG: HDOD domain-containing protein [Bryobacteraceae bacterium]